MYTYVLHTSALTYVGRKTHRSEKEIDLARNGYTRVCTYDTSMRYRGEKENSKMMARTTVFNGKNLERTNEITEKIDDGLLERGLLL